jgi:hypothetical protein
MDYLLNYMYNHFQIFLKYTKNYIEALDSLVFYESNTIYGLSY